MSEKIRTVFDLNIKKDRSRYYTPGQSGCQQEEAGTWRPEAAECRNERYRAQRDIEQGKFER